MPINITECITNLTPYDVIFVGSNDSSRVIRSMGVVHCRAELRDSPIAKDIAAFTGGTPVKLDACTSFFCTDHEGVTICERLPMTKPGQFLLVTEEIAKYANQHKIYRGIIFPREYKIQKARDIMSPCAARDLMVISQLGTFWSHPLI